VDKSRKRRKKSASTWRLEDVAYLNLPSTRRELFQNVFSRNSTDGDAKVAGLSSRGSYLVIVVPLGSLRLQFTVGGQNCKEMAP
jgi:hypothetical protein